MNEREANDRIQQMISFVLEEAKNKKVEIEGRTEKEFAIAKGKHLHLAREKLTTEYARKWKQLEVKKRIERSATINATRMEAMRVRNDLIDGLLEEARFAINQRFQDDQTAYRALLKKLIVQGLIKLLDQQVVIRCRQVDVALVRGVIPEAVSEYSALMLSETGKTYAPEVTLDSNEYLPGPPKPNSHEAGCSGGVMLSSFEGKIRCINTLDERLRLVFAEGIPALRQLVFS